MRIYLDIDGVLLDYGMNPAIGVDEFIEYLVSVHDVFWLTTHCKGDAIATQIHLSKFLTNQATIKNLSQIMPTNWDAWKTEGIDFSKPFIWIDDDLYPAEERTLKVFGAGKSIRMVDLRSEPDALGNIISELKAGDGQEIAASANMPE